jgi:hypothetical protein
LLLKKEKEIEFMKRFVAPSERLNIKHFSKTTSFNEK